MGYYYPTDWLYGVMNSLLGILELPLLMLGYLVELALSLTASLLFFLPGY